MVERRALQQLDVVAGDDHLQPIVGADLVGERGRQVLVEAEVVPEVLARSRREGQAEPELVGVGFLVTHLDQLGERGGRDRDDRLARGGAVS